MTVISKVNSELERQRLAPLVDDQVACLSDPLRLEDAAGMLSDLRDRCSVRLPPPEGAALGGPFDSPSTALPFAVSAAAKHLVVVVDEMATDESRSTGAGNEFYVTGFDGPDAAVALAEPDAWVALWVSGVEHPLD
jgi:hypothetical protein